jgi:methylthioribose-1-phosphate isomerase
MADLVTARRSLQLADDGWAVDILDQTALPHTTEVRRLTTLADATEAIRCMRVRGAPLIGALAAYGLCLALRDDPSDAGLAAAVAAVTKTRPTAVNLVAAVDRVARVVRLCPPAERAAAAYAETAAICDEDVHINQAIGEHGLTVLEGLARGSDPVQVLTHCNAGWLATVGGGTALAPVYAAVAAGVPVHVWVSETRPRSQGLLTSWELSQADVPHTVIVDNAAGRLIQQGRVDVVLVGTDRTTAGGDVCNKIGTYLRALAARDNGIPFYACVPGPSIDWHTPPGAIPIEERDPEEVRIVPGTLPDGRPGAVRVLAETSHVANPAFDVTPARLVTGLITERGVSPATADALRARYPERAG